MPMHCAGQDRVNESVKNGCNRLVIKDLGIFEMNRLKQSIAAVAQTHVGNNSLKQEDEILQDEFIPSARLNRSLETDDLRSAGFSRRVE